MRRLLLLALLLASNIGWAGTCGNGYAHPFVIRLQKAVGSDLANFPYPLKIQYTPLATAANGGQVQNTAANSISVTGPADFVLCDAASAGNPLKYEVAY